MTDQIDTIIERLEAGEVGREIAMEVAEIRFAFLSKEYRTNADFPQWRLPNGELVQGQDYPESLDAVVSLVPEDAFWQVVFMGEKSGAVVEILDHDAFVVEAPTPATALCIAALRAIQMEKE